MKEKRTFLCFIIFCIFTAPVFGQELPLNQQILTKYNHIFQREDIQPVLSKALEGLQTDYIQERITVDRINEVVNNPGVLKQRGFLYLPGLDDKHVTLLREALPKENGELREMFRDPAVLSVLQNRAAIAQFERVYHEESSKPLGTGVQKEPSKPLRINIQNCGGGWEPYRFHLEMPKVMIYALEFEYDSGLQAGYRCKTIEIRTGDDSIENLAGWQLYLGTLYNQSHFPLKIPEEHSQITDGILRLTPDMLGIETFPCNTVNNMSHPLPGVHYVLKTDGGS